MGFLVGFVVWFLGFFFPVVLFGAFFFLFVYNEGKTGNNVKVPQLFNSSRKTAVKLSWTIVTVSVTDI